MSLKDFLTLLMPFNRKDYIVLGNVSPFLLNLPYKIHISDRYDHMHIIGTTGKGKSKLDVHKDEIVALLRDGVPKKRVAKRYSTSIVNLYNWIAKNELDVMVRG